MPSGERGGMRATNEQRDLILFKLLYSMYFRIQMIYFFPFSIGPELYKTTIPIVSMYIHTHKELYISAGHPLLSGTRAIEREFFAAGGELQELVPSSTLTNGWDRMRLASAYNEVYNKYICTFHNVFRRNMQPHRSLV
jgi:hypothetical protein